MEDDEEKEKKELEQAFAVIRRSVTIHKLKCLHQNIKYFASNSFRPIQLIRGQAPKRCFPTPHDMNLCSLEYGCICCDCGLRFSPPSILLRAISRLQRSSVRENHEGNDALFFKTLESIEWLSGSNTQLICSLENMAMTCSQLWLKHLLPHTRLLSELFPLIMAFLDLNPLCTTSIPWIVVARDPVVNEYEYRAGIPTAIPASDMLQIDSSRSVQLFAHRCPTKPHDQF